MKAQTIIIILSGLLFTSLSANMYMAGVVVGRAASTPLPQERHFSSDRKEEWRQRGEELKKNLSEEDRAVMERVMEENKEKMAVLKGEIRQARDNVSALMQSENPDPAELDAALKLEKEKKMESLGLIQDLRRQMGESLSEEGRAVLDKQRRQRMKQPTDAVPQEGGMRERFRQKREQRMRMMQDKQPE